jgi:mRNA interferase MazF
MVKIDQSVKDKLVQAMKIIVGYRSVSELAQAMKMVDSRPINDLLRGNISELPNRYLLRKLASASEGRITYIYLYSICGYSETDPEEDRTWMSFIPKRSEIYLCDFGMYRLGSEQRGPRPALIIGNDVGNTNANICLVIPITSKRKASPKMHVFIGREYGLYEDSYAICEQVQPVCKQRFYFNIIPRRIGILDTSKMEEIEIALDFQLGKEDLMFNKDKAFTLYNHYKSLQYNIMNKQSKDLIEIANEKFYTFITYCRKHLKDYEIIIQEYERINDVACAV